jgi:hypothetical protein
MRQMLDERLPYFDRGKYAQWMLDNNMEEEGLLNYFNNDFLDKIEGEPLNRYYYIRDVFNKYSITSDKIHILDEWNVDSVFAVPIWNDFSEIEDAHLIHPDWVEWK